jgi:hypothetical protein
VQEIRGARARRACRSKPLRNAAQLVAGAKFSLSLNG